MFFFLSLLLFFVLSHTVDLTNGQLTPNNNTPLLTQALSGKSLEFYEKFHCLLILYVCVCVCVLFCITVMNNYQAAAAAAHSFAAPSASPHATTTRQGFPSNNSPGPAMDMYSSTAAENVGYVQATSPQPSGFPIAVSRAPLNYSPVS